MYLVEWWLSLNVCFFSTGSSASRDEKHGKKILDLGYVGANSSFVNVKKNYIYSSVDSIKGTVYILLINILMSLVGKCNKLLLIFSDLLWGKATGKSRIQKDLLVKGKAPHI